jgi:sugar (pentulose or hexulose) kinase
MRGAALLALEAAGKIQSIEEFSMPVETVFEPNILHRAVYRDAIDRQQRLYKKMFTGT